MDIPKFTSYLHTLHPLRAMYYTHRHFSFFSSYPGNVPRENPSRRISWTLWLRPFTSFRNLITSLIGLTFNAFPFPGHFPFPDFLSRKSTENSLFLPFSMEFVQYPRGRSFVLHDLHCFLHCLHPSFRKIRHLGLHLTRIPVILPGTGHVRAQSAIVVVVRGGGGKYTSSLSSSSSQPPPSSSSSSGPAPDS